MDTIISPVASGKRAVEKYVQAIAETREIGIQVELMYKPKEDNPMNLSNLVQHDEDDTSDHSDVYKNAFDPSRKRNHSADKLELASKKLHVTLPTNIIPRPIMTSHTTYYNQRHKSPVNDFRPNRQSSLSTSHFERAVYPHRFIHHRNSLPTLRTDGNSFPDYHAYSAPPRTVTYSPHSTTSHVQTIPFPEYTPPVSPQGKGSPSSGSTERRLGYWSEQETRQMLTAVKENGTAWTKCASSVQTRDDDHCEKRWRRLNVELDTTGKQLPVMPRDPGEISGSISPKRSLLSSPLSGNESGETNVQSVYSLPKHGKGKLIPWTIEEDSKLSQAVQTFGQQWSKISDFVGTRNNRQCKEHYLRVLAKREATSDNSDRRTGFWSPEEDAILLKALDQYGPKWGLISSMVPGRNHRQCEKRYRRLKRDVGSEQGNE